MFALTERVIGLAIEVHRVLGPGLLASSYEKCLCYEFDQNDISYERQVYLPLVYKQVSLDCGYRIDLLVEHDLIIEIKTVDRLQPIHDAQLLTYLRLSRRRVGLLLNFHTAILKDGIRRMVL